MSVYLERETYERDAAERMEALADEHDRDATRYPAPPPHTLERIVHAQFQAFMLEVAIAELYVKHGVFDVIDLDALTLKCEAFCDSLAMMQADDVTSLAAD